jgi:hypothetical protein
MSELLSGMLVVIYAAVSLFFFRFWKTSRDRLFMLFGIAFAVLASQRLAIALTREILEHQAPLYLLRAVAFLIIIAAIVDKNRR